LAATNTDTVAQETGRNDVRRVCGAGVELGDSSSSGLCSADDARSGAGVLSPQRGIGGPAPGMELGAANNLYHCGAAFKLRDDSSSLLDGLLNSKRPVEDRPQDESCPTFRQVGTTCRPAMA